MQAAIGPLRRILTCLLLAVWLMLIGVGVLSAIHPDWLEEWSSLGATSEATAYKRYGDALLHQGEYSKAVAQYNRSLEIDPDRGSVMVNLAVAYRSLGMNDRSARMLQQALRLEGDQHGLIAFNLGELAESSSELEKALEYYRQAVDGLIEQDLVYRKIGALLLQKGDYERALQAYERCLQAQTDNGLLYRQMLLRARHSFEGDSATCLIIRQHLNDGLSGEALAAFDMTIIQRLRQNNPEIAKTHNHLGFIHYQLQNMESAREHFSRSLAIWPGNRDASSGLAAVSRMGGARVHSNAER